MGEMMTLVQNETRKRLCSEYEPSTDACSLFAYKSAQRLVIKIGQGSDGIMKKMNSFHVKHTVPVVKPMVWTKTTYVRPKKHKVI